MAIEAVSATVPLKAGERLAGLNHVAQLRARYWGDCWKEVERFVDDMRDNVIHNLKKIIGRWPLFSFWQKYRRLVMSSN